MRLVSVRRAVPVCIASAAALALSVPGIASAKKVVPPKTDVLEQCSGTSRIELVGSTFQAPAEFVWTGTNSEKGNEKTGTGFNVTSSSLACSGSQGSHAKPEAYYNQANALTRGSGACLKTYGEGIATFGEEKEVEGKKEKYPRVNKYPVCGTDEAPSQTVKEGMESEKFTDHEAGFESGKGEAIESIPVAQGAEAIIVHLPKDCLASSEILTAKGKTEKLGRLALDQEVLEKIYTGQITTWAGALAAQGSDGHDTLTCTEGGEGDTIRPVVREDKSGTTHIFKSFLAQVNTEKHPMEAFVKLPNGEEPCKGKKSEAQLAEGFEEEWKENQEGCANQRWPAAAKVLRPTESGNPGVVNEVNSTESSLGYADLAVAREKGFFSKKTVGGENKKEEINKEFWAVLQNSAPGKTPVTFADPGSKGDTEKVADSNCKDTVYVAAPGEEFPPLSTRFDWSKVKAEKVSMTYPICGLTYVLAARQYYYFLEKYGDTAKESQEIATTVHDYVQWVVNTKSGGGGNILKNHDYEALTKTVQAEAEFGAEEIGSKEG